jgi:hypothetical protein
MPLTKLRGDLADRERSLAGAEVSDVEAYQNRMVEWGLMFSEM